MFAHGWRFFPFLVSIETLCRRTRYSGRIGWELDRFPRMNCTRSRSLKKGGGGAVVYHWLILARRHTIERADGLLGFLCISRFSQIVVSFSKIVYIWYKRRCDAMTAGPGDIGRHLARLLCLSFSRSEAYSGPCPESIPISHQPTTSLPSGWYMYKS